MFLTRRSALLVLGGAGVAAGVVAAQTGGRGPATARARQDLYNCEGCEAVTERSAVALPSVMDLAPRNERGDRMTLTGQVVGVDGRPAAGVIIYAHHTNADGLYAGASSGSLWSRRHGRLRGWVRTDADGRYIFRTIKPAPYPDRSLPAHVHLYIGEPGRRPYYIDDVVFDGEFGVTPQYRERQELRGGSGIVKLARNPAGVLLARRDICLERHPG